MMWIDTGSGLLRICHVYSQSNDVTGERNVPLPLGLAAYCTLVDSFDGLKVATSCILADSSSGSTTRGTSRYAKTHGVSIGCG